MSITIDLPNSAIELLRRAAQREGIEEEKAAAIFLIDTLEQDELDRQEMLEGIDRGFEAFEAGRHRPFEDFAREQRQKYGISSKPSHIELKFRT